MKKQEKINKPMVTGGITLLILSVILPLLFSAQIARVACDILHPNDWCLLMDVQVSVVLFLLLALLGVGLILFGTRVFRNKK